MKKLHLSNYLCVIIAYLHIIRYWNIVKIITSGLAQNDNRFSFFFK